MKYANSKSRATDCTWTAQKKYTHDWTTCKDGANSNENAKPVLGNTELCEHLSFWDTTHLQDISQKYLYLVCFLKVYNDVWTYINLPHFKKNIKECLLNMLGNNAIWYTTSDQKSTCAGSTQDCVPALALAGSDEVYVALYRSHEL